MLRQQLQVANERLLALEVKAIIVAEKVNRVDGDVINPRPINPDNEAPASGRGSVAENVDSRPTDQASSSIYSIYSLPKPKTAQDYRKLAQLTYKEDNSLAALGRRRDIDRNHVVGEIANLLPAVHREQWYNYRVRIGKEHRLPCLSDLANFLNALASIKETATQATTANLATVKGSAKIRYRLRKHCPVCASDHHIILCPALKAMTKEQKAKWVKNNNACRHPQGGCFLLTRRLCATCEGNHLSLFHELNAIEEPCPKEFTEPIQTLHDQPNRRNL